MVWTSTPRHLGSVFSSCAQSPNELGAALGHSQRSLPLGRSCWGVVTWLGHYCGRLGLAFGLVQLAQTELVRAGSLGSCSRTHTAQVTRIGLGGDIGGLTSISWSAVA